MPNSCEKKVPYCAFKKLRESEKTSHLAPEANSSYSWKIANTESTLEPVFHSEYRTVTVRRLHTVAGARILVN